jgi:uncharacterized phage-associated protein
MPNIYDFDAALRQRVEPKRGTLGMVARHKLLYAVHRMSIAETGAPAFHARCEAWLMGPVFPEFYHNPQRIAGSPDLLSTEQQGYCDLVARILGAQSGRSLAARSHWRYPEWFEAKKRRTDKEITVAAIRQQLALVRL